MRVSKLAAPPRRGRAALIHRLAAVALAAALAGAPACGGGGSTGPRGLSGTYELVYLNQTPVPVEIHHGPHFDPVADRFYNQFVATIEAGELTLQGDGFTLHFDLWIRADGHLYAAGLDLAGTVERDDEDLYLVADTGKEFWGLYEGGAVMIPIDFMGYGNGFTYRFER